MPYAEQDEYFRQFAIIARKLGANPVPESKSEAEAQMREMRSLLSGSPQAREVAHLVLEHRPEGTPPMVQETLGTAAVDLLPSFARAMLGLERPGLATIPARLATSAASRTLRWAFRQ